MANSDFTVKIEAFWAWFALNRLLIEQVVAGNNHPKTQTIVEQFDHHILDLGRFKWMLDNPYENYFTLTLSPNKDPENHKKSRAIIADAPYYPNWAFYDHIQSIGLSPFEIYDAQMDIQEIDPEPWMFSIKATKDKRFDLTLMQTNCEKIDVETREIAAEIALSNLIGEALRIEKISQIKLVSESDDIPNKFYPFHKLPALLSERT